MKTLMLVAGIGLALSGCATSGPQTAWGKAGVSRVDYGTEVGMCTGLAATQKSGSNGSNTAGGISGSNNSVTPGAPGSSGSAEAASAGAAAGGGPSSAPTSAPVPAVGTYSGMASSDFAERAATQQRAQEMAAQRARSEALKTCLVGRGYQEFSLTAEQRTQLAAFRKGSNEYHEYLYQLGSNAEVITRQARATAK